VEYRGRYPFFDFGAVTTYPLAQRPNVLKLAGLVHPSAAAGAAERWCDAPLAEVAGAVLRARDAGLPVILFTGAHIIKLGFSPLIVDLMQRGLITLLATNGAGSIHDFELALIGETSENVPNALPAGLFGMAQETGHLMNQALAAGNRERLGYGEAMGRLIATGEPGGVRFPHRDISLLGRAYELGIPATVHATLGTDIIDQHPEFDGEAKGGTSGRDFGVFAAEVCRLQGGGVVLNVGSAISGPEVLLKTVSMAANVGHPPHGLITANFDLRTGTADDIEDPAKAKYYYRDVKSIVTRIPRAFGGAGYMVAGNFLDSIPALYDLLTRAAAGA
jgi:hypothetical protein